MATKQFTALKDFRYGTRMLRAGDPVDMDGSSARLFTALGAIGPRDADGSGRLIPNAPAPPKAAAKRKPAKKKVAKKAK
jgi:hypothetical protein